MPLRVTLRPYAGREYVETVPVRIPDRLAGQPVQVEVASGALVRPDVARPESLRGFIDNLRSYYTASTIVVSLSLPEDGASLRGRLHPQPARVGAGHPAHRAARPAAPTPTASPSAPCSRSPARSPAARS